MVSAPEELLSQGPPGAERRMWILRASKHWNALDGAGHCRAHPLVGRQLTFTDCSGKAAARGGIQGLKSHPNQPAMAQACSSWAKGLLLVIREERASIPHVDPSA